MMMILVLSTGGDGDQVKTRKEETNGHKRAQLYCIVQYNTIHSSGQSTEYLPR